MSGNPLIWGASRWGGPTQVEDEYLLNYQRKAEYVSNTTWYTRYSPLTKSYATQTSQASGDGLVGLTVAAGIWKMSDQDGNTSYVYVEEGKRSVVVLQTDPPDWSEGAEPTWITVEDSDMESATVGGMGTPILARALAESGQCVLGPVPKGYHLIVKYPNTDDGVNLWFVAFNADGPLTIDIDLEYYPTEIELADAVSDVTVEVDGSPVTVSSIDAMSGKIILASAPASIPTCTYWANIGDVWA